MGPPPPPPPQIQVVEEEGQTKITDRRERGGAKNERKLMGKAVSYGRENGLRKKVSPL